MEPLNEEQQMGIVIAQLKDVASAVSKLDERLDALERRVEDKFRTIEIAFKVIRYIGLIGMALVSLRFADSLSLWEQLWS